MGVFLLVSWKFWTSREAFDNYLVGIIHRIENKDLNGFLQVKIDSVSPKGYDIIEESQSKPNKTILINGGARNGKTELGMYLCLKLLHRKIVISFKKFQPTKRDFDIGYHWIDVSQYFPNLFSDGRSFCEAFRCAFFSDLSSRGLMIDTILTKVNEVMESKPQNFEEFFKALDRVSRSGQWDSNITNIVKSKVKKLQIEGAKHGVVDFRLGNIVIDLGNLPDDEVKSFVAELFLRQINRLEEESQNTEKIYLVIDEAWHCLMSRQQQSIIGTMLLQGAYYIHLIIITQNYTQLDEEYRGHVGSHYCFRNTNDTDLKAIADGYGAFVRDGVRQLPDFCYTDLRYAHGEIALPYWKLNWEKLQRLKEESKQNKVNQNYTDENFGEEVVETVKVDNKTDEDLKEKIIFTLEKSDVSLYGYQIAKAVGLSSKDAIKIRQPLRKLLDEEKIIEDKLQLRKKVVTYYSLPDTEQFHNLMLKETEDEDSSCGCRIVKKAIRGVSEPDFEIEKNERVYLQEVESGRKSSIGDFNKRVEGYDKITIIILPNAEQKERYSYLSCVQNEKAKICLIPEIEKILAEF